MRQAHWKLTIVIALIAMPCGTSYAAENRKKAKVPAETERKVTEKQVPAAALKTLKQLASKAEITEFAEEIEHGSTFYEGSWKTKAGTNMDVLVTKAGALVEIEEQMPPKKLPTATLKAAQKLAGKGTEIASEKKTMILYEIKFNKDGAGYEILLTPDGRVVEQEKGKSDDGNEDGNKAKNRDGGDDKNGDDDEDEDNGQKISIKDVPKAVRATVRKSLDGGKIEDIEQIGSGKKVIYEVDIIVNGKEVELQIAPNGKVTSRKVESDENDNGKGKDADDEDGDDEDQDEDEVEVSIKDVPKAVRATILKAAGNGKVEEITKETEDGKVIYDVEIELGDKDYELEVAPNGKLLEMKLVQDDEDHEED